MALRNWHDGPDCVVFDERAADAVSAAVPFPLLPGEQEWMRVRRQRAHDQATRTVELLIQSELHANEKQLVDVVTWLTTNLDMAVGERIVSAFMQSNMGATVDREVYHPLLRARLSERWPLSFVVPVTASECDTPRAVLEQIGKQLWTCVEADNAPLRQGKQARHPPRSTYTLDTMCAMAQEWARDHPQGRPLCVVLLDDFSKFDRCMLRALFQSLAEAQHRRLGHAMAFCVVLWASSEVVFEADLADHLYLARFRFIPPSMMLQNVLLAVLVEPTLPFALPHDVYTWVTTHFELHSHSLTWMRNVLRALVTLHFFHRADLWLLHARDLTDVSDKDVVAALSTLQLPDVEPQALRAGASRALAAAELGRWVRCRGFIATWRLLRRAVGDAAKPLLVAYGDYLRISGGDPHGHAFALRVKVVLETCFHVADPEQAQRDAERACDAVDAEIDAMVAERRASGDVGDREVVQHLLSAKARLAAARAAPAEAPVAVAPDAIAPTPPVAHPRDRLLGSSSTVASFQRTGSSGGNSRVAVRATVLSNAPHMQAAERAVAALVACVRVLVDAALAPPVAQGPLARLFEFRMPDGGGLAEFVRVLVGDSKRVLVNELLQPSLGCECCAGVAPTMPLSRVASSASGASGKRRRVAAAATATADTAAVAAGLPGRWDHIYSGGPLTQLATREDITIAFLYYYRIERPDRKLDVEEWFAFFSDVLAGQDSLGTRFQRVMQDLQLMGLIGSVGGKTQQMRVRKTD